MPTNNLPMGMQLVKAAKLLEEVKQELDQTDHICSACGLNVKHNFVQAQIAQQLQSMITKLKRFQAELLKNHEQ